MATSDKMSIDKKDTVKDDSEESVGSSPDGEQTQQNAGPSNQEPQPPRRKGGRKPIYATTEERKQRNRQAQAAFRERRTEYIKQLEDAIRVHENNLNQLQIAHRSAADECLMLRYKNSLLERILLEKGIDVQLELRAKTGSPNLGPTHMPQNLVQPPPIQRAIMNRHHAARRSASSIKTEPGAAGVSSPLQPLAHASSPKTSRPTPSSHSNSPGSTSNAYGSTTSASPVASDPASSIRTPTTNMMKPQIPPMQTMPAPPRQPTLLQTGAGSRGPFFSTPSFQNHYEQLEQEYESQADMIDDSADAADTPSAGPGPYPGAVSGVSYGNMSAGDAMIMSPTTTGPPVSLTAGQQGLMAAPQQQNYPSMTQLLDQDWDPFGLSASMQFPSQFSFDTSNMR